MKRRNLPPTEQEITDAMETLRKLIAGGYIDKSARADEVVDQMEEALNEVAEESGELEA